MHAVDIQKIARQLFDAHGTKAISEAAQKAAQLEKAGNEGQAKEWRQVEDALKQMSGPHAS
jgi:hypothetical protein